MNTTRKAYNPALVRAQTGLTLLILRQTQERLEALKARMDARK